VQDFPVRWTLGFKENYLEATSFQLSILSVVASQLWLLIFGANPKLVSLRWARYVKASIESD